MKNSVMEKESLETYKNRFIHRKNAGPLGTGGSECILFCKKVSENVFDIKDGCAFVAEAKECFNDGVCMISNFTKVVFVFDQAQKEK
jgi:hypothetical protein